MVYNLKPALTILHYEMWVRSSIESIAVILSGKLFRVYLASAYSRSVYCETSFCFENIYATSVTICNLSCFFPLQTLHKETLDNVPCHPASFDKNSGFMLAVSLNTLASIYKSLVVKPPTRATDLSPCRRARYPFEYQSSQFYPA